MTSSTQAFPVDRIAARAREVRFTRAVAAAGRVIALLAGMFFIGIGMVIGGFWRALVFLALSAEYGFRAGAGKPLPEDPGKPGTVRE